MLALAPGIRLFLASASPRRAELLASLGLSFEIRPAYVEEPSPFPGETGEEYARRLAALKGNAALVDIKDENCLALAADTIVSVAGLLLGKPKNEDDTLAMLLKLNGRQHDVITALYVARPDKNFKKCLVQSTKVWFHEWPKNILRSYARTGEPRDKAGAYAIQGKGAFLVDRIEGSWTNVVGLPLASLAAFLLENGFVRAAN